MDRVSMNTVQKKIRVLVVDDSAVARMLVSTVLSDDPILEVVGVAANGQIALAKIPHLIPDLVTLDIEMPVMDGLETLVVLRKDYPNIPVIMFSSLTERGAAVTVEALALGACDYVSKPSNAGSSDEARLQLRDSLVPKIKAVCGVTREVTTQSSQKWERQRTQPKEKIEIVAIGSSTGGPVALERVITKLPAAFPVPIVIVQHMPPLFTRSLADRLSTKSHIQFEEGTPGAQLASGKGWIAPGDFHMQLSDKGETPSIELNQGPPKNSCRPAVDVLFQSVVQRYGSGVLAIILTGMGQDGLLGCEMISNAGGQIVVQDEASSVVWGMPGAVAEAGFADRVLPLKGIAEEIVARVTFRRTLGAPRQDPVGGFT